MDDLEKKLASEPLFPERKPTGEGILPSQEISDLVATGIVSADSRITEDQIQPSSLDLRLSTTAYKIQASFLPSRSTTLLNKAKSNGMLADTIDISQGAELIPKGIYIIPLMERLTLPSNVYGIANPKSSTGRLDIFTRLITEIGDEFERVERGYRGQLYIEVIPQTFPIIIRAGMRLNQLRFGRGSRGVVGEERLKQLDQVDFLVQPDEEKGQAKIDRGLRLTVDLQGNGSGIVGYQAKKTSQPIDLDLINHYDIDDFWIPIRKEKECILQPGEFYILASKQKVRIPPDLAAEMLPYDLSTQEFRVHYAGFFDPGFGYGENGEIPGTRAVLEVRANEMPILLEDDQFVGRLNYYNMAERPQRVYGGAIGSNYQQQGLALSKQFKKEQSVLVSKSNPNSAQPRSNGGNDRKMRPLDCDEGAQESRSKSSFAQLELSQLISAKARER